MNDSNTERTITHSDLDRLSAHIEREYGIKPDRYPLVESLGFFIAPGELICRKQGRKGPFERY